MVVRDSNDLVALYMSPGIEWLRPRTLGDQMLRVPTQPWMLGKARWQNHVLRLSPAGETYSVLLIWDEGWVLRSWYINMEEPLRRSEAGFDYMDWALDIVVTPDMRESTLKDEDELREFVDDGLMRAQQAEEIRATAQQALDRLLARQAPFDERWEDWRPNPGWRMPTLPEGA